MGNVTAAIVKRGGGAAGRYSVDVDFTLSASYATGGDTIVAADIANVLPEGYALTDLIQAQFELAALGYACYLDKTNKKIKVFNGTTEIANATNLSAVVVRCHIQFGQSTGPI